MGQQPRTPLRRYGASRSRHRHMKERRTTSLRRSESIRRTPRNSRKPSVANNEGCSPRLSNLPPSVISPRVPWRRFQIRRLLSIRLPSPLCWSALRRSPIRRLSRASIHSPVFPPAVVGGVGCPSARRSLLAPNPRKVVGFTLVQSFTSPPSHSVIVGPRIEKMTILCPLSTFVNTFVWKNQHVGYTRR